MKITIITVCKNSKEGILKTVESVKAQSYSDIEHIIIDGGSTDGTVEALHSLGVEFISEFDDGIYPAMNKGIRMATGDYILFLNAKDVFYSVDTVSNIVKFLIKNPAELLVGNVITDKDVIIAAKELTKSYLCTHSIAHQGVFFKRELFNLFGLYSKKYKIVSDYEWFLNYFLNNKGQYLLFDEIISEFDTSGISSLNLKLQKQERKIVKSKYFTPWERLRFAIEKLV